MSAIVSITKMNERKTVAWCDDKFWIVFLIICFYLNLQLSVHGGSAWEWNPERRQFYLHQFGVDQPDFNYRHYKVIEEMKVYI